jgi:hypothetical protein
VTIDRVEIKDVSLPETMKRSMARQAEAVRDRRARVINADAELQASKKLAQAAEQMSDQPAALQLRLLQTVVAVAAEKNSTLVLPFPVELLRFLERAQGGPAPAEPRPRRSRELPPDDEIDDLDDLGELKELDAVGDFDLGATAAAEAEETAAEKAAENAEAKPSLAAG